MRRRIGSSASSPRRSIQWSKTRIRPCDGRISPAISRSITVLPEPLPPMITSVSPRTAVNDTPRSTSWPSKRLRRSMASTIASGAVGAGGCARIAHAQATHQKSISMSLVRKKSEMITPIVQCTTVAVVARPSPSVPPVVLSPL